MSEPIRDVILEDFGAALHVEHDGILIRFTMVPDDGESEGEGVSVVVTHAQARKFARDITRLAAGGRE